jgi:glycosyltransferase EpsE
MHVTVVLSVYNQADSLPAAIESLFRQTYSDWDLLAIDDASTDGSLTVLQRYGLQDRRVRVLRNVRNMGLAASLNIGWRTAKKGDLIARLDADDECLEGRLAAQVAFFREHPNVDVLGTGAELLTEKGAILGQTARPERHDVLVAQIYRETPFIHPSVMMRRNVLETLDGYDGHLRRAEDADLWLRAYRRFRFHNLQTALIRYRVRKAPLLADAYWGTFVLGRAALREGRLFTRGWYAARFLAACLLGRAGIWKSRLKPAA